MLSLFFLYYYSFSIPNALFVLQNFRFAILTSLCGVALLLDELPRLSTRLRSEIA